MKTGASNNPAMLVLQKLQMPLLRQNEPLLAHTILRTEVHVYHLLAVIMGMIDTH